MLSASEDTGESAGNNANKVPNDFKEKQVPAALWQEFTERWTGVRILKEPNLKRRSVG